jgi:hypothetical protein
MICLTHFKIKYMAKILTIAKKKKIENTLLEVLWEQNDPITRDKVKNSFSKILGFEVKDVSNPEMIDRGFAEFSGYDPKTKRVVDITIGPGTSEEGPKYIECKTNLLESLEEVRKLKLEAVKEQNFERACSYREREKEILDMISAENETTK